MSRPEPRDKLNGSRVHPEVTEQRYDAHFMAGHNTDALRAADNSWHTLWKKSHI